MEAALAAMSSGLDDIARHLETLSRDVEKVAIVADTLSRLVRVSIGDG
jgi:hypothetical protein